VNKPYRRKRNSRRAESRAGDHGQATVCHPPNRLQIPVGSQSVMVLYGLESGADFEPLIAMLNKRLGRG